jgi:mRNA interferase HigB
MRLAGRPRLLEFMRKHARVRSWVSSWEREVSGASWKTPQDVKDRYGSVSFIDDQTAIFDVQGNNFRMEVTFDFQSQLVLVKRCGTHAEYDRWTYNK